VSRLVSPRSPRCHTRAEPPPGQRRAEPRRQVMINNTPAISCSLAPAARAAPGGPLPAACQRAEGHRCPQLQQRHRVGVQGRYRGRAKPEPGPVLDEVFVCERQPAQGLLGFHWPTCLRPIHRQSGHHSTSHRGELQPSAGINLAADLAGHHGRAVWRSLRGSRIRHSGASPRAYRACLRLGRRRQARRAGRDTPEMLGSLQ
jgi:hypothetical protein